MRRGHVSPLAPKDRSPSKERIRHTYSRRTSRRVCRSILLGTTHRYLATQMPRSPHCLGSVGFRGPRFTLLPRPLLLMLKPRILSPLMARREEVPHFIPT